jgi:hypothetical protein
MHTQPEVHTWSYTHSLTHSHSNSLSLSLSLSHTHTLSLSLIHTHTHSLSHTHTLSLSPTHSLTHTHASTHMYATHAHKSKQKTATIHAYPRVESLSRTSSSEMKERNLNIQRSRTSKDGKATVHCWPSSVSRVISNWCLDDDPGRTILRIPPHHRCTPSESDALCVCLCLCLSVYVCVCVCVCVSV